MAFNRLMLTTDGKTLYAKAQQGKPLRFTRVGLGDGLLGNGSLVNRPTMINERLSVPIDAIQMTAGATEAAVIVTLKNAALAEGFSFRELALFAKDPDTQAEKIYLYDHAGNDAEYIPAGSSGVAVYECLKLMIVADSTPNISFDASGNPLCVTAEDLDARLLGYQEKLAGAAAKATPADEDKVPILDSADFSKAKLVLWRDIKALFAAAKHGHDAADVKGLSTTIETETGKKADKLIPSAAGNLAGLDAAGNLTDSGKKAGDFAAEKHRHSKSEITDFPSTMSPAAHKLTHQTGGADALVPGDIGAYTKAETLSDATKAALGLPNTAVPDEALALLSRFQSGLGNEYLWEKFRLAEKLSPTQRVYLLNTNNVGSSSRVDYSDSISISLSGVITLLNPSYINVSAANFGAANILAGKYFSTKYDSSKIYKAPITGHPATGGPSDHDYVWFDSHIVSTDKAEISYVNSASSNAYPPTISDGFTYTAIGHLAGGVSSGSYQGLGNYGVNNPTVLVFNFEPKLVIIAGTEINGQSFGKGFGFFLRGFPFGRICIENYYSTAAVAGSVQAIPCAWEGNSLKFYGSSPNVTSLSLSENLYRYVAIG